MKKVPTGAQNFAEWLIESLYGFLEDIIGPHLVKRTFWLFATIFIFILAANWLSLFPGIGSMGWGHQTPEGFQLDGALLPRRERRRQSHAGDGARVLRSLDRLGPSGSAGRSGSSRSCSRRRARAPGALRVLLTVVFFAAGCLEVISILFRPISLSFRLYGNVFAGESMLETMAQDSEHRLAGADSLLFPRAARRARAGARVHALDRGVHAADLPARAREKDPGPRPRRANVATDAQWGARSSARAEGTIQMVGNLHVGLAALGAAIAVGLIGMKASRRRSDAIPARPRRSWSSRFWPSPSPKRSSSTRSFLVK